VGSSVAGVARVPVEEAVAVRPPRSQSRSVARGNAGGLRERVHRNLLVLRQQVEDEPTEGVAVPAPDAGAADRTGVVVGKIPAGPKDGCGVDGRGRGGRGASDGAAERGEGVLHGVTEFIRPRAGHAERADDGSGRWPGEAQAFQVSKCREEEPRGEERGDGGRLRR